MSENAQKPRIRFKGFSDAWEQRKLDYYLEVSNLKNADNAFTKEDVLSVSGDFGVVNQIEFQGRSFAGVSVSNYGIVQTGDVVYTKSPLKANPFGIIKTNKGKTGIVSVLYGVYHTKERANANFIQTYFEQDARLNNYLRPLVNKGAKNTLLISDTDALAGEVCFAPTLTEQCSVGQFFATLDNLITLHQRKYDKLVAVKKSLLEKMFPADGETVPKIRFKGFSDAWEQRKLDYYLEVSNLKNADNAFTKEDVLSVSGDFGVVNQIEFQGRSFAGVSVSNYGIVQTGDVVYTKSPLKANPFGIIKTNKGKTGIVSVLYGVYHTKERANANFIQTYFEQDARLNNYLRPLVNKGAKNTLLISDTDALAGEVCFAPTLTEQCSVGQFFATLDNLITLHQRQLEKLKNIKSALLEKMFV